LGNELSKSEIKRLKKMWLSHKKLVGNDDDSSNTNSILGLETPTSGREKELAELDVRNFSREEILSEESFYTAIYLRTLEVCVAQTFAQIKLQNDEINQSDDADETKKSKRTYLLGISKWGLQLQKDLEDARAGKPFDNLDETTQKIVNGELDKLLKVKSYTESLTELTRRLESAKKVING
jgi:FlaA1/EpsC-like NDP-sugar epimerase